MAARHIPVLSAALAAALAAVPVQAARPVVIEPKLKVRTTTEAERAAQRAAGSRAVVTLAEPVYPFQLDRQGIMGCIRVAYDVLPSGKTDGLEVLRAWPDRIFEPLAIHAVFNTEYEAGPKTVRLQKTYVFSRPFAAEVGTHLRESPEPVLRAHCEQDAPISNKHGAKRAGEAS